MPQLGTKVEICYTNHRGETAMRRVIPARIVFGVAAEWHIDPQWLLEAYDLDRKADRTFAMRDIHFWRAIPEDVDGQTKEPSPGDAPTPESLPGGDQPLEEQPSHRLPELR